MYSETNPWDDTVTMGGAIAFLVFGIIYLYDAFYN